MNAVRQSLRLLDLRGLVCARSGSIAVLAAALAVSACANKPEIRPRVPALRYPGSQQDFVVNVGDRVFFEIRLSRR